jgi:SNF2 family DNA or RNA helicase
MNVSRWLDTSAESQAFCQSLYLEHPVLSSWLILTLRAEDKVPSRAMGGILADVMGLGKTLSILSAIVSSRLASISYQTVTESRDQESIVSPTFLRSRATLVVVTSLRQIPIQQNSRRMSLTCTRSLRRMEEGNSNVSQDLIRLY